MTNHLPNKYNHPIGWGKPVETKDVGLLNMICDYFNERIKNEPIAYENSVWFDNVKKHALIIRALRIRDIDYLHEVLRNQFSSPLTHGTGMGDEFFAQLMTNEKMREDVGKLYYDKLLTLMEMTELIYMFNPEEYFFIPKFDEYFKTPPEKYLKQLSEKYNFDITAPKYSGNLFGLQTDYGVYHERDFISIGVALLIAEKFENRDIKICEIGGGTGHLAFYLHRLGYKNISLVDLPTMSVSQMYFLLTNQIDNINFISPKSFTGEYDVVINVDSITEMNMDSAKEYCEKMKNNTKYLMSINHEAQAFKVSDVCKMKRLSRNPFWLRRGYVLEEYTQ